MIGTDFHDPAVQERKRRMGWLGLPLRHCGFRPQGFQVVASLVTPGAVELDKSPGAARFLNQIVPGLIVEYAEIRVHRRVFGITVEPIALRIHFAAPLDALECVDYLLPGGSGGVYSLREPEVTGIAHARPAGAPRILQWTQRPVPIFRFQLAAALMLH